MNNSSEKCLGKLPPETLRPNFNTSKPPVEVAVERSSITEKWLCVAYILGQRVPVSPHFKKEDAKSASDKVFAHFNQYSITYWRDYKCGGKEQNLTKVLIGLDYDDEILGVGKILPDGTLDIDSSSEARSTNTQPDKFYGKA